MTSKLPWSVGRAGIDHMHLTRLPQARPFVGSVPPDELGGLIGDHLFLGPRPALIAKAILLATEARWPIESYINLA